MKLWRCDSSFHLAKIEPIMIGKVVQLACKDRLALSLLAEFNADLA
jgi:hypothetical protein